MFTKKTTFGKLPAIFLLTLLTDLRPSMKKIFFLTFLLLTFFSFAAQAKIYSTNTLKDVETKALELGQKYGTKNVLVVFDIDNTIMTMPQDLGSDQWFSWLYDDCIKAQNLGDHCITEDMGELLDIQGQIFGLSNMLPTEYLTTSVVTNLQAKGHNVILLTSRGPEFRSVTERSLRQNNMSFKKSAIGTGTPGTYLPYDVSKAAQYGLTPEDIAKAGLKGTGRPVSYMDGVYMTAGQHKGAMLKVLLHKAKRDFKAIVFADDHSKHTTRMQDIFGSSKLELAAFRYGAIDESVRSFHQSEERKQKATDDWTKLRNVIQSVLQ